MRVMVIVKADKDSEAGVLPDEQILTEMGNYNEELVKAGIMLAGEGLQPSSKGARVRFSGDKRIVTDGPFIETKELLGGFIVLDVPDEATAVAMARGWPALEWPGDAVEVRPVGDAQAEVTDPR